MAEPRRAQEVVDSEAVSLLGRVGRGEAEALRGFYELYAARVLAVALRVLKNRADAEEILQETFLEAWRRSRDYDCARGSPSAWLLTICRTRAIDRLRTRVAQERARLQVEPSPEAAISPAVAAEQRQVQERVRTALSDLSDDQRAVLELAYFEGLSQSEIAERTGHPLGTVKTRVRLGMAKLSTALSGLWGGRP